MALSFLVPGPLDQLTGGYLFARQIIDGLRGRGRSVAVIELAGRFPEADETSRAAAAGALAALPAGSVAVIDGLALPAFEGCLRAEAQRLRLIGFIHHPLALETGLRAAEAQRFAALEARLWPLLRGVICASAHTAAAVVASGLAPPRVEVATPGTAKPEIIARRSAAPPLQLLTVGTVTPRKGHLVLIEALSALSDCDWRLVCIGSLRRDPAAAAVLRHAIAANGLEQRVALLGETSRATLEAAYRDADLFVLPSYHEGYGMAFAEALAYGLPIVATTAGAIPDTVPADAALLVPRGDVTALREALQRMLTDEALRTRLAAGAMRAGATLPDWPTAVECWTAAFDRLAA